MGIKIRKERIEDYTSNLTALALADRLLRGGYTGSARDLENLIIATVTGASGISIVPTSPAPTGTGIASFTATQAGTYTNYGGVIVESNSFAIISRSAAGAFSISQTAFDLTTYVKSSELASVIPSFASSINNITYNSTLRKVTVKKAGFSILSKGIRYNIVGNLDYNLTLPLLGTRMYLIINSSMLSGNSDILWDNAGGTSTGLFQFLDNVVPTQSQILCLVSYDGTIQTTGLFYQAISDSLSKLTDLLKLSPVNMVLPVESDINLSNKTKYVIGSISGVVEDTNNTRIKTAEAFQIIDNPTITIAINSGYEVAIRSGVISTSLGGDSAWLLNSATYTVPTGDKFVKFIIKKTDGSVLTDTNDHGLSIKFSSSIVKNIPIIEKLLPVVPTVTYDLKNAIWVQGSFPSLLNANRVSTGVNLYVSAPFSLQMSIDPLYKIAVWYSLNGVDYDAIYNTGWKYNGNIVSIPDGYSYLRIIVSRTNEASILPSDIPSISVLGLKTTSTARISTLSNIRDAILPFQKIEKLIPKETQFLDFSKTVWTLGSPFSPYANTRINTLVPMILISPFNIKVSINPLYKIGCSYSADGVNYSTSLDSGYVYNGGSFKVPLGYDYARFTIALVTDAGVSVSSFIDANVSLTYSSDKTFLDSTTVTKIIGARIVNDNHNFNTYMVLSHRGFNNVAPENTLEAYALSVEKGYKYFETDISWTSDGVPVLLHDNTIDRTSNGTGNISSMTFATARTYDFGSWKSPEYTGVKIPSFEEFVHMCLCENAIPCFETKSNLSDTQLSTLLSILSKYGMLDKCMWLSSYSSNLVKIVNLKPNATVVYVPYTAITQAMISIVSTFQNGVNKAYVTVQKVHLNQNTLADIILAKNSNIGIIAWDVFSNEECFELAKLGVVGFTVDAVLPKDILKQSTYYLS